MLNILSFLHPNFLYEVYSYNFLPLFYIYEYILYIYVYILISSFTICIKIEICIQKKHMLVNVSAKAFISITFQNQMEHTHR